MSSLKPMEIQQEREENISFTGSRELFASFAGKEEKSLDSRGNGSPSLSTTGRREQRRWKHVAK